MKFVVAAIVIFVIAGLGMVGYFYFTRPKHGEQIKAPEDINAQIHEYFAKNDRKAISEIKFFRCTSIHWGELLLTDGEMYDATVKLKNKGDIMGEFRKVFVLEQKKPTAESGKWKLIPLIDHNPGQRPCENQFPK